MKNRPKFWVLREVKPKRTNYFEMWTGIGPKAIQVIGGAERFRTKRLAMQSPAYSFSMTFYEPHAVRALKHCAWCLGVGWRKGGKTIQTDCVACRGTGVVPA